MSCGRLREPPCFEESSITRHESQESAFGISLLELVAILAPLSAFPSMCIGSPSPPSVYPCILPPTDKCTIEIMIEIKNQHTELFLASFYLGHETNVAIYLFVSGISRQGHNDDGTRCLLVPLLTLLKRWQSFCLYGYAPPTRLISHINTSIIKSKSPTSTCVSSFQVTQACATVRNFSKTRHLSAYAILLSATTGLHAIW